MLWRVDILEILSASLLQSGTIYDPAFATRDVIRFEGKGIVNGAYLCELVQKSVAIGALCRCSKHHLRRVGVGPALLQH